jgi:hypothetical protein
MINNDSNIYGLGKSNLTNKHLSRIGMNENLSEDYLFDPENVTQETIRQFMLFLNLP